MSHFQEEEFPCALACAIAPFFLMMTRGVSDEIVVMLCALAWAIATLFLKGRAAMAWPIAPLFLVCRARSCMMTASQQQHIRSRHPPQNMLTDNFMMTDAKQHVSASTETEGKVNPDSVDDFEEDGTEKAIAFFSENLLPHAIFMMMSD